MKKISEILNEYKNRIDYIDIELIIANSLGKTREFVLMHPEYILRHSQAASIKLKLQRRLKGQPVAYITGHKEFYGLDFIVNKHTLIPRPETELMVEQVLELLRSMLRSKLRNIAVIDVGTGSGCIAIAITNEFKNDKDVSFYADDISSKALKSAKKNAQLNNVDKKIKFLHGDLLLPFFNKVKKINHENIVITANLPYLSKEIYSSAPIDVKKYEPKTALYSPKAGLAHYEKLLKQINKITSTNNPRVTAFFEISPEQKKPLSEMVGKIFPSAKIKFAKDLAGKWRLCKINW